MMHSQETRKNKYRVKVGLTEVVVLARTVEEAIANARRQLALEMPRFYDVIHRLAVTQFEVSRAA